MRQPDIIKLWGLSAAHCSRPECRRPLIPDLRTSGRVNIGEMAHIVARSPRGPRGKDKCPGNHTYENLILLCPNDHRLIDMAPADFPARLLRRWKHQHERWVERSLLTAPETPVVWRMRKLPNYLLSGRSNELKSLGSRLEREPVQILHGLPGVGKSQLVAHYAADYSDGYSTICWVRAEDATTLGDDLRVLAEDLQLPSAASGDPELVYGELRSWLASHDNWLLIFDGTDSIDQIRCLLPSEPSGHVIVTTQDSRRRGWGQRKKVPPLSFTAAAGYLLSRTESSEQTVARELARELGSLPLALEQCAAYILDTERSLAWYLKSFRRAAGRMLEVGPVPDDYHATVSVTVALALKRAQSLDSGAEKLLRVLAFCSPEPLPRQVLDRSSRATPPHEVHGAVTADRRLAALRRYSLVEMNEETVAVHSLVQQVVRARLPASRRLKTARAAQELLSEALPQEAQEAGNWPRYQELLPHLIAVCDHMLALEAADATTVRLLDRLATYLQEQGRLSLAKQRFEQALSLARVVWTPVDERALRIECNTHHLITMLEPSRGRLLLGETVHRIESALGDRAGQSALLADTLNDLGHAEWLTGDNNDGSKHLEQALAIYARVYAESAWGDHLDVINCWTNLGLNQLDAGQVPSAQRSFERALQLVESRGQGEGRAPNLANALSNLGVVYLQMGRARLAARLHRRAIGYAEAAYGQTHVRVAVAKSNLGAAMRAIAEVSNSTARKRRTLLKAFELHEDAERIALALEPPNSSMADQALNNQGLDLWQLGDLNEAEKRLLRALAQRQARLGGGLPVVQSLTNVARVEIDAGKVDEAELRLKQAASVADAAGLDLIHHQRGVIAGARGEVAKHREKWADAVARFDESARIFASIYGPESSRVTRALTDAADAGKHLATSKRRILVLADLSPEAMRGLRACADVIHVPGRRPTSSELDDVEVIIARSHVRIDSSLLKAAHALKLIVRPGSGLDNVDLGACARRGVEVRRLGAGPSARSVAEFALGATLVLLRRLGVASQGLARGEWLKHELLGTEIADRRVAIWGFGPVGAATAELLEAVGADVRVYTRSGRTGRFSSELSLAELADWAHVHVLALPLTADTHGLLSEDVLRAMTSRAPLVINVSRWAVIDFAAALRALKAGAICGLAIDPVDREHVPFVRAALEDSTLNLLVTPHVGANTEESLSRMGRAILDEVCTYLSSAHDVSRPSSSEPQPPEH